MAYRITIKHSKNDRLLWLVENEVHKNLSGVLSGILKDMMTDDFRCWWQLEFYIEAHALETLCDRLFWAETHIGYCLDMPVGAIEVTNALL